MSYVDRYGQTKNIAQNPITVIDNYIYLYHTETVILLPVFPESIADNTSTTFSETPILGRSAPIYTYSSSGPRQVEINLKLHRDMLNDINTSNNIVSYSHKDKPELLKKVKRDDYMEVLIAELQSAALPVYEASKKLINPPIVAIRIGDEIFCKGVIQGGVRVNYSGPILANNEYDINGEIIKTTDTYGNRINKVGKGKYALVDIGFSIYEIDPYDAVGVASSGSFRGLSKSLERNIYKVT